MKISLITVAYNSSATIKTTLESVKAQCYPDLEYIIVDGGSKDTTVELVKSYPELDFKLTSEPDRGIYDAMNKGVKQATGDIVGILNSDDFFRHDDVLREVSKMFSADPSLDVVFGDVDFVADTNLTVPVRTYRAGSFKPWMLRIGLMPPHPAVFVRKSAYDRVGLYKMGYKIAADFDFLVRLLLLDKAKFKVANKQWVRMRTGGASTAGIKSNIISSKEMNRSLKENGLPSAIAVVLLRLPIKLFNQVLR